ncbi:anti-sigma factor [Brevibacterium metallidurans]|uniref:Anti-sigma K factor RskA C-terminal domain-containing protein n=1 Tax=Brevibacterium metallidurans TaxID=1482676 RepID=A0ABP3C489_9MICO
MSADRDYLAAGLALGGLSDDELAEARALTETDPEFRAEVEAYADTVALMALSDEPQTVSAETRQAILAVPDAVAREDPPAEAAPRNSEPTTAAPIGSTSSAAGSGSASAAPSATESESAASAEPIDLAQRRRRRMRTWLPWAAAAAAVILVVTGFSVNAWQMQRKQDAVAERLEHTQRTLDDATRLLSAPDLKASTTVLATGGTVTVVSSEAEQAIRVSTADVADPQDKSLQMWVIGADGAKSAGLLVGSLAYVDDSTFGAGSQFGITVEPSGGSEQPTTEPILAVDL